MRDMIFVVRWLLFLPVRLVLSLLGIGPQRGRRRRGGRLPRVEVAGFTADDQATRTGPTMGERVRRGVRAGWQRWRGLRREYRQAVGFYLLFALLWLANAPALALLLCLPALVWCMRVLWTLGGEVWKPLSV